MVGQKNGTEKMMNDKTKLVKEAKNDKASRWCWSAYQKRIRQNRIREVRLGKERVNIFIPLQTKSEVVRNYTEFCMFLAPSFFLMAP